MRQHTRILTSQYVDTHEENSVIIQNRSQVVNLDKSLKKKTNTVHNKFILFLTKDL